MLERVQYMSKKAKVIKKIEIPLKGGKIAGVCMALANYFNIDVTIVRIIFVLLSLPGGLPGIIPYIAMWILIPEEN